MSALDTISPTRFKSAWKVTRVGEYGTVVTGGTPRTATDEYWEGQYPWITPTDISSSRDVVRSSRMLTERGLAAIRRLPAHSVLVTCIASIGKNAVLRTTGGCNQQINAIVPNTTHDANFLYYLFEYYAERILAAAGTTATPIVSKQAFSRLSFRTPSLGEQRAIAKVLSDLDELIRSLEALVAKKRAIEQAVRQELTTGRVRLPGFRGEWEATTFDRVLNHHSGESAFIKGDLQGRPGVGYYPGFSASGQDVWLPSYAHTGEALVVSAVGSRCGRTFRATGRWTAIANTHVVWPVERLVSGRFLRLYLDNEEFWLKGGSGQPFVQFRDSFARPVRLPPVTEQRAIASVVGEVDAEIFALEQRLDKSRAIKQGAMQQLLSGSIRLPISDDDGEVEDTHAA